MSDLLKVKVGGQYYLCKWDSPLPHGLVYLTYFEDIDASANPVTPTKADLDLLINTAQATMLKAQDKTITSSWPLNWNGADSLRLNIIPCGTRYRGSYGFFGTHCDVWSITDSMVSNKWGLEFTQNGASEYNSFDYKNGYSVRLIKDAT